MILIRLCNLINEKVDIQMFTCSEIRLVNNEQSDIKKKTDYIVWCKELWSEISILISKTEYISLRRNKLIKDFGSTEMDAAFLISNKHIRTAIMNPC